MPHANPIEPKIVKLVHIGKTTFNINGTTMHSTFVILLNKNFNELKTLNDEKHNTLLKKIDQLWLLIIDEISLLGNKILTFVDHKWWTIKKTQNWFMGGLDVVMTWILSSSFGSRFLDFQITN